MKDGARRMLFRTIGYRPRRRGMHPALVVLILIAGLWALGLLEGIMPGLWSGGSR